MPTALPIDDVLPELISALAQHRHAVLQAPPGAGKTTRVPLALHDAKLTEGKIIMLEPRRLAARAAAERLAHQLGEAVGETVGYAMRGDRKSGPNTRIEVVTEGILTRMIQNDCELAGIGAIIFDEFHERSLNADLGLALCLEIKAALREDLLLLVMSATLDAAPVAGLLGDAPVVTSQGRSFPVTTHFLSQPKRQGTPIETTVSHVVQSALEATSGGILVFLPGEREIRRTQSLLAPQLPEDCIVRPLFGAMPFAEQRATLTPEAEGLRKIVLATSIAETSLTIDGIRTVVDSGLARRARFDPGTGMERLVTEPVSKAEAAQRAGRAGRQAPGDAFVCWAKGENGGLPRFAPAEIETADLSGLALELALWGTEPEQMPFLTTPNPASYAEAQALLKMLGALQANGQMTQHGRRLARIPAHPRIAHMLETAGAQAARLAALLTGRDPLGRNAGADLSLRLEMMIAGRLHGDQARRITQEAKRFSKLAGRSDGASLSAGAQAALAYPDRIGQRRSTEAPRFVLSGGKGAVMDSADPLSTSPWIVVTDTDGAPRDARIRGALAVDLDELRDLFEDQIEWHEICFWSKRTKRVEARIQEKLGACILQDRIWKDVPAEATSDAMLEGLRDLGLRLPPKARRFVTRVELLRSSGESLPDMSEEALLDTAETWLLPFLDGVRSAEQLRAIDWLGALQSRLDWPQNTLVDQKAPAHFETPLGRHIPIDYAHGTPHISLRLQEMFGITAHPIVAGHPLTVTLLSPAGRPVQTTKDIVGFWDGSYADVRKDMRGRYPKHPWPEDPRCASPTLRAKARKK